MEPSSKPHFLQLGSKGFVRSQRLSRVAQRALQDAEPKGRSVPQLGRWISNNIKRFSRKSRQLFNSITYYSLRLNNSFQIGRVWNNFPIRSSIRSMLSAHPILESVLVESSRRILMDQVETASVKSRRVTRPPYETWVNSFPDLNSMNGTSINRSKYI